MLPIMKRPPGEGPLGDDRHRHHHQPQRQQRRRHMPQHRHDHLRGGEIVNRLAVPGEAHAHVLGQALQQPRPADLQKGRARDHAHCHAQILAAQHIAVLGRFAQALGGWGECLFAAAFLGHGLHP
jgi:hypothetical protein